MSILSKIFGDANLRAVQQYQETVKKINELEPQFERFSNEELKGKTEEFKKRIAEGQDEGSRGGGPAKRGATGIASESLDDILPEAFAVVREASKRTLGQRHFDVQLIGGMVLHDGKIAEMRTGEGKTLVATLPAYLNALTGKGVHIVTVNDYLSRRDAVWMAQIHHALGLTVGVLNHETSYVYDPTHEKKGDQLDVERDTTGSFRVVHEFLRPVNRREAYEADITYGTNNEYGFDYLRDNMAYSLDQMVQRRGQTLTNTRTDAESVRVDPRPIALQSASASVSDREIHNFAIVDEIDSILIDEARTPLIISAPDTESTQLYETFAKMVPRLIENEDYNVDEKLKAVSITEKGIEKVEKILNVKNIYEEGGTRYVHQLEQALKANILFHLDKDYVVKDGEVIIVDEFTGRLMPGRRWSGGLHQAVEAKEKVLVQKESRTFATITFQNYFRLYGKLSGMTGTAQTSAEEFHKVYGLDVITAPTNKPMIRTDLSDRIYKTEKGKMLAVAAEVKERHLKGQPVLVGTTSISKNETLSAYLDREGVPHKILNAKNHEQEGEIIAQAGRAGAVTVATNMAGRGVDIILGGNPPNPEDAKRTRDVGGLHVIGTERHEARRIDNQLRGRSGRQGDQGSSQFFVSAEDELIRIFGGDRLKNLMERLGVGEDEAIENSLISRAIEQAQSKVEGNNFDVRKYVLEYDDVMNKHRTAIYDLRKEILSSADSKEKIIGYVNSEIEKIVAFHASPENPDWNIEEISENIKAMVPSVGGISDIRQKLDEITISFPHDRDRMESYLLEFAGSAYAEKEKQIGADTMRQLEKAVLLRVIDELWVDHLEQMEYLRDSVRLRAYGQRDPLVEYKIEGQRMFNELQSVIGTQVANIIFKIGPVAQTRQNFPTTQKLELNSDKKPENLGGQTAQSNPNHLNIGRNDPCYCGSGKKFKKCHGK